MKKRIYFLLVLAASNLALMAQNISFPPTTNPPNNLGFPTYTRAPQSIHLLPGPPVLQYNPATQFDLLNLSLGTNPTFVSSGYLGSGINPMPVSCSNPLTVINSAVVGETSGEFMVSPTGAAVYKVPITVAPGTKGIEPKLTLSYNSQAGVSILGIGWNLQGLSAISRTAKTVMHDGIFKNPDLSVNDVFALDGFRLFALNGTYGQNGTTYYTESENFSTITSYVGSATNGPEKFEIKDRNGNTLQYGYTIDSRFTGVNDNTVLTWYLNRITDEFGNYMDFKYLQLPGERVLDRIEYTGNSAASLTPYNSVQFGYIPIAEKNTCYVDTVQFKKTQLLKSIACYSGTNRIRRYSFEYKWNIGSYLSVITETDADGNELAPTTFCWNDPNDNTGTKGEQPSSLFSSTSDYVELSTIPADMDGDGFTDYLCFNTPGGRLRYLHNDFKNAIGTANNTIQFTTVYDNGSSTIDHTVHHLSSSIADQNNDNKAEIYTIINDLTGYLPGTDPITGTPGGTCSSFKILKNELISGSLVMTTMGTYNTTVPFNVNAMPTQFIYDVKDLTGDGTWDNVLITHESIQLTSAAVSYPFAIGSGGGRNFTRPFSFNGDACMEYIIFELNGSNINIKIVGFNGSALTQIYTSSYTFSGPPVAGDLLQHIGTGDFNGDGIGDIVYITSSRNEMYICLGTGNGFATPAKVTDFTPLSVSSGITINLRVEDINGDGLSDVVVTDSSYQPATSTTNNYFSYFSVGDLMMKGPSYSGNWTHSSTDVVHYLTYLYDSSTHPWQWKQTQWISNDDIVTGNAINQVDLNGDGVMDVLSLDSPGLDRAVVNNLNSKVKECIYSIQSGLRKKIDINYANINSEVYANNSTKQEIYKSQYGSSYSFPLTNFKPNLYCVRSTIKSSGFNFQMQGTTQYQYLGIVNHALGKGLLGFEQVLSFDDFTKIGSLSKYSVNIQFNIALNTETRTGKILTNIVSGVPNWSIDNNNLVSKNVNTFQVSPMHSQGYFAALQTSMKRDYLSSTEENVSLTYNLTQAGNVTSKITSLGWGTSPVIKSINQSSSFSLLNGVYRLLNQTVTQTQNGQSSYVRAVDNTYDSQGRLTSTINDQNISSLSNSVVTTQYQNYNLFGIPTKVIVSAPDLTQARTKDLVFDATGRFITKEINAFGDFKEYTYDGRFGKVIQEKDITGLITNYSYDGLGRLKKTIYPNLAQTKITYAWESPSGYPYSSTQFGVYSTKTEVEANGYSKVYYSSNGEVLRTETNDYAGQIVIADTKYNLVSGQFPLGIILETSEAHYPSQSQYLISQYDYENIFFRLKTQTTYSINSGSPVNTGIYSQTTYNANSTDATFNAGFVTTTNQNSQATTKSNNSAGQTVSIKNSYPGLSQTAAYNYHSNGKPLGITLTTPSNPGQNIVHSFSYDDMGNLIQEIDPSQGTILKTYNSVGELMKQQKGADIITNTYDALDRILTSTGNTSGATTYQYVTTGAGKENIDKVFGPNSTTEYKYDNFNRVTEQKETLLSNSKVFKTTYAYDTYGRITQYTYPNNIVIKNTYNAQGHLTFITDATNHTIWQLTAKDAKDRITQHQYGNGINTTNAFGVMNDLSTITHGAIHKQTYKVDPLTGNLQSRTFEDYANGTVLKETFNFDVIDRLTKSTQVDPTTNSQMQVNNIFLDVLGNITHKDDAGDYNYTNTSKPFTLINISNATSNFNPNTLNVTYTEFDKVRQISEMGSNKQMDIAYGTDDQRIRMDYLINGTNQYTRYYADNYDRQETSNGYKEWVYINTPSGLCAVYYNNNGTTQLQYVLSDNLGSPLLITNGSGSVVERYSFDSWGRRRNPVNWSYNSIPVPQQMIRGYTLHEQLDELDLINMNGRVYAPIVGRFIQPDDRVTDEANLQTYDRYAYCKNNPLKYIDPTGHEEVPGTQEAISEQISDANFAYFWADYVISNCNYNPIIGVFPSDSWSEEHNNPWNESTPVVLPTTPTRSNFEGGTVDPGAPMLTSETLSEGAMSLAHAALDIAGIVPGIGEIADGTNAALYAYEGDYLNAGLSAAGMIPFAGWAATGGKMMSKSDNLIKVYRVYGDEAQAMGGSWTPVNPSTVENYRNVAGLPNENSGRFVIEGTVQESDIILQKFADPIGANVGGLPEYIINPYNVNINRVSGVNPQY
jgi:RHS repeat-associated protein